jgi:hypothetical protein
LLQTLLVVPAFGCVVWAWSVRPKRARENTFRTIWAIAYANVPVAAWLVVLASFISVPLALTLAALVVAHAISLHAVYGHWTLIAQRQRRRIMRGFVGSAILMFWLLWLLPSGLYAAGATAVIFLVLLVRAPGATLTPGQARMRYWLMFFLVYAAAALFGREASFAATIGIGSWFLVGTVVTCLMALSNDAPPRKPTA